MKLLLAAGSLGVPERTDEKSKNNDETIFGGSEIVVRTPSLRRSFAETRTCEWRVVEGGGGWWRVEGGGWWCDHAACQWWWWRRRRRAVAPPTVKPRSR